MTGNPERKILIFGAGKIGRSFIGQLFSRAGYEVVFIDTDREIITLLNEKKSYRVVIKDTSPATLSISNVRGIHSSDKEAVSREIISTQLIALSVGQRGLDAVLETLAVGLGQKHRANPGKLTDIIIAENIVNGDLYVREKLSGLLGPSFPVDSILGLIETSIGKMVPIMSAEDLKDDPLQVFAESYNTLILAGKSFKNPVPDVPGLAPMDNMKAWVDRKLFIHNLGHATAAYLGFLKHPDKLFLYQVLSDREIYDQTFRVMKQSAAILSKKYPAEFSEQELEVHILELLQRFMNRDLKDTVFRVGCDLRRKLSKDDRMVYPIQAGRKLGMQTEKILYALVCGFYFRARDERGDFHPDDSSLFTDFSTDIEELLTNISGFETEKDKTLLTLVREYCADINTKFAPETKIT